MTSLCIFNGKVSLFNEPVAERDFFVTFVRRDTFARAVLNLLKTTNNKSSK